MGGAWADASIAKRMRHRDPPPSHRPRFWAVPSLWWRMWRIDGWMSQPNPALTIDTGITLSHSRADMVEIIRHPRHQSLAIVIFSRT